MMGLEIQGNYDADSYEQDSIVNNDEGLKTITESHPNYTNEPFSKAQNDDNSIE